MDGYLDGSTRGFAGRLEIIEGRSGRRRRSAEDKARIVAESLLPGARVADVARRHGATRWQVYDWRRQFASGKSAVPAAALAAPEFAALVVEAAPGLARKPERRRRAAAGVIEVVVAGIVIRAGADAEEAHLARVIRAVRSAAG